MSEEVEQLRKENEELKLSVEELTNENKRLSEELRETMTIILELETKNQSIVESQPQSTNTELDFDTSDLPDDVQGYFQDQSKKIMDLTLELQKYAEYGQTMDEGDVNCDYEGDVEENDDEVSRSEEEDDEGDNPTNIEDEGDYAKSYEGDEEDEGDNSSVNEENQDDQEFERVKTLVDRIPDEYHEEFKRSMIQELEDQLNEMELERDGLELDNQEKTEMISKLMMELDKARIIEEENKKKQKPIPLRRPRTRKSVSDQTSIGKSISVVKQWNTLNELKRQEMELRASIFELLTSYQHFKKDIHNIRKQPNTVNSAMQINRRIQHFEKQLGDKSKTAQRQKPRTPQSPRRKVALFRTTSNPIGSTRISSRNTPFRTPISSLTPLMITPHREMGRDSYSKDRFTPRKKLSVIVLSKMLKRESQTILQQTLKEDDNE